MGSGFVASKGLNLYISKDGSLMLDFKVSMQEHICNI